MQYIRIDKALLERPVFASPSVRCLWLNLLFLADWETGIVRAGGRTLAEMAGISHKAVRVSLEKLAENGLILIGKGTLGAQGGAHQRAHLSNLVTICDFDTYKGFRNRQGTPPGTPKGTLGAHQKPLLEETGCLFNDTTLESSDTEKEKGLTSPSISIPPNDVISDNTYTPLSLAPSPDRKKIPPKFEWVKDYCEKRGKGVDPEEWFAHYQSNGWKVGKTRMVDWQAAVRTWEKKRSFTKLSNAGESRWDKLQRDMEKLNSLYNGGNENECGSVEEQ